MNIDDIEPVDFWVTSNTGSTRAIPALHQTGTQQEACHSDKEQASIRQVAKHEFPFEKQKRIFSLNLDLGSPVKKICSALQSALSPKDQKRLFAAIDLLRQQKMRRRYKGPSSSDLEQP